MNHPLEQAGFTGWLLYSADNCRNISNGSLPELLVAVNFGIGNHQGGIDALAKVQLRGTDLYYILHCGTGINISMFHGGTSFGFMSGDSSARPGCSPTLPATTRHAARRSRLSAPKFFAYRQSLATFSPCGNESCLPTVLAIPRLPPSRPLRYQTQPRYGTTCLSTFCQRPSCPMEQLGQSYGYILYRTQVLAAVTGSPIIDTVHSYAQVYLNGRSAGTLDRRFNRSSLALTANVLHGSTSFFANDSRINFTKQMRGEFRV